MIGYFLVDLFSYLFIHSTHVWSLHGPVCSRLLSTTLLIIRENVRIAVKANSRHSNICRDIFTYANAH